MVNRNAIHLDTIKKLRDEVEQLKAAPKAAAATPAQPAATSNTMEEKKQALKLAPIKTEPKPAQAAQEETKQQPPASPVKTPMKSPTKGKPLKGKKGSEAS